MLDQDKDKQKKEFMQPPVQPAEQKRSARQNILRVFETMGGIAQMTRWALENPNEFYKIYSRLAPAQLTTDDSSEDRQEKELTQVVRTIVDPQAPKH